MRRSLLGILADPLSKIPLQLEVAVQTDNGDVLEGILHGEKAYPIINGIPRFVMTEDLDQQQTQSSFSYKWEQEDSYAKSSQNQKIYWGWLADKYGFGGDCQAMSAYFRQCSYMLDAGCGAIYAASMWLNENWHDTEWVGLDISQAVDIAYKRLRHKPSTNLVQGDILQAPFLPNSFDLIFSEGVLHHTPSTRQALLSLVSLLRSGGEIMFYVYRKKGPIREFTDDYIRQLVADLPPEQAWEMLRPLTRLGQALAGLHVTVDVPEAIPYLDIKPGPVDIQRFVYWNIAKMFWNNAFTFEENHHINFDWYHPKYAHRQTDDEIRIWCAEAGLNIHYFHEQESGYTVRAFKE